MIPESVYEFLFPQPCLGSEKVVSCVSVAQVAELADALGSGPSASNGVQVRFLSWAIGYGETSYVT